MVAVVHKLPGGPAVTVWMPGTQVRLSAGKQPSMFLEIVNVMLHASQLSNLMRLKKHILDLIAMGIFANVVFLSVYL